MFHNREATKGHDKIYALLGMSSTDMEGSDLLPDYTVPFGQLFGRLIRFIISKQLTTECEDDKEAAVLNGRGYVLGLICNVMHEIQTERKTRVFVAWRNGLIEVRHDYGFDHSWVLRSPATPLKQGDFIILLEGAAEPSIIRLYEDFSAVIVAVAMLRPSKEDDRPRPILREDSAHRRIPKQDFLLIWDWNYSLGSYSNLGRYSSWAKSKDWMSVGLKSTDADPLDNLSRLWECATIRLAGRGLEDTVTQFRVCLHEAEGILQIAELHAKGREHLMGLIYGMIGTSSTTLVSRSGHHVSFQETLTTWFITSIFHWAAQKCHENIMDLIIATGHVNYNMRGDLGNHYRLGRGGCYLSKSVEIYPQREHQSMTPLQQASWDGDSEHVRWPFLEDGVDANVEPSNITGTTALQVAAEAGSLAIVERLLEMGADINAPAGTWEGMTALQAAAKTGNMVILDRLLRQNADVNAQGAVYGGRTAFQAAAEAGHMAIVQRLVQHHADINAPAGIDRGRTALQAAAEAGHLQIVECLLEHKADVNAPAGRTALEAAAGRGHFAIVERLKQAGASTV